MIGKLKRDVLKALFGNLQLVMECVVPEFKKGFIVLKDPVANEFLIGQNSNGFLSMLLRYPLQPDELLGAVSFEGCDTIALCVRSEDILRVYFRGHGKWDSQGELHLWQKRKKILRIELVDRTVNQEWNFAGIGMNVVYETKEGKSYAKAYDNTLRPLSGDQDE